mmetsp:Transcript_38640/g.116022  ORF Transcript_38640/g.116022 Transcript_38640/m.116022 type:complete len:134 (-) Transcript_38640:5162-5563(-)
MPTIPSPKETCKALLKPKQIPMHLLSHCLAASCTMHTMNNSFCTLPLILPTFFCTFVSLNTLLKISAARLNKLTQAAHSAGPHLQWVWSLIFFDRTPLIHCLQKANKRDKSPSEIVEVHNMSLVVQSNMIISK